MKQLTKKGRQISTGAAVAAAAAKGIMKSPSTIRKSGVSNKASHSVSTGTGSSKGEQRVGAATNEKAIDGGMGINEKKWRQPLLDDGTKVPLTSSGVVASNNIESYVELSVSFCRDILSCRDGPLDLLDGASGAVAASTQRKFFCVLYAAQPRVATVAEKIHLDGRDDVDEADNDRDTLPPGCIELGKTEVIRSNSTTPNFEAKFVTSLRFRLDTANDIIVLLREENGEKLLDRATFGLERMIRSAGMCESSQNFQSVGGSIVMKVRTLDEHLVFCLAGKDLKKRGGAVIKTKRKARNPYIVINAKINDDSSAWSEMWRSEVYRDEDEATDHFGFGRINMQKLDGKNTKICILAFDDKNQSYKLIGQVDTTARELLCSKDFEVTKKGKKAGNLVVRYSDLVNVPTMLHYLRGKEHGTSLDLVCAVDFTSNNGGSGDPNSEGCLHRTCVRPNDYEAILRRFGDVFTRYTGVGMRFGAWGFGALNANGQLQNRFALGLEEGACDGAGGLINVYRNTLRSGIVLSNPKRIRPSLDAAIERALQNSLWRPSYSILLVLCSDGKISDLAEVTEKLTQASHAPLSVVFVGVGDGKFSDFYDLAKSGSKEATLEALSGNNSSRDVAHFVKLNDLRDDMDRLIHRALMKVPNQFLQHQISNGLLPLNEIRDGDDVTNSALEGDAIDCENLLLAEEQCYSGNKSSLTRAGESNKYEADLLQLDFATLHTSVAPTAP